MTLAAADVIKCKYSKKFKITPQVNYFYCSNCCRTHATSESLFWSLQFCICQSPFFFEIRNYFLCNEQKHFSVCMRFVCCYILNKFVLLVNVSSYFLNKKAKKKKLDENFKGHTRYLYLLQKVQVNTCNT